MRFPIAAITDEFSPDADVALAAMSELGMTGAELRVIAGRNVIDLSDAEIDDVRARAEARGIKILSIASPVLKCELPGGPPTDDSIQRDVFGKQYAFHDQPRLAERAFEIAARTGARIVRVFSYWRTIDPPSCFNRVAAALRELADQAAGYNVVIGLENEHACNVATAAELADILAAVDHPALQAIWDPANAMVAGDTTPFPDGYAMLPLRRIAHVHAKDCTMSGQTPTWGPLGEMGVDWRGQIDALARDGYRGAISLETHWKGPRGDKFEASQICGRKLRELVSQ